MKAISYRKSVAWGKALGSLLFVLVCLFLLYVAFFTDATLIHTFFCITSAIIGIPFFGGYLVVCLPRALKSNTQLLTYDQKSISDGKKTVAWVDIENISYSGPSIQKWLFPQFPQLIFHLKNRGTWTVLTYYLLTDSDIQSIMKLLSGLISRNGKEIK
ncbi:hypothetical protein CHH78_15415 [Shouchella clausii]|uniref:Uncharacterized protein n=1 Tax=Shouchella clausii TaxID=79880 RepID=A0A268RWU7_SHOCL|nr:DUF5381 family protein [Shouchella clausii]PAD42045.1 hypothetical protein CHH54_14165 [Bacillus sp. 7520-S]MBU8598661.1 DUF5381 family protein [Shouchella clausii]MCY1104086.1 DUF5381 family protein [Shouchella clausii]MED4160853.1 DUF5381 family protein [Shouchella clausii]MED4174915.1 DUF5381 family protein [Shouchella clausii]